jgi:hypothetical protein
MVKHVVSVSIGSSRRTSGQSKSFLEKKLLLSVLALMVQLTKLSR